MARSARKSRKRPDPIVDLEGLPAVLVLEEVAAVYRLAPDTIRRALSVHKFQPLPFDKYPLRWRREDILQDLATPRIKLRSRKHGFAATKARRDLELETVGR